eukprot:432421-Amphidinium_carterae.1
MKKTSRVLGTRCTALDLPYILQERISWVSNCVRSKRKASSGIKILSQGPTLLSATVGAAFVERSMATAGSNGSSIRLPSTRPHGVSQREDILMGVSLISLPTASANHQLGADRRLRAGLSSSKHCCKAATAPLSV